MLFEEFWILDSKTPYWYTLVSFRKTNPLVKILNSTLVDLPSLAASQQKALTHLCVRALLRGLGFVLLFSASLDLVGSCSEGLFMLGIFSLYSRFVFLFLELHSCLDEGALFPF